MRYLRTTRNIVLLRVFVGLRFAVSQPTCQVSAYLGDWPIPNSLTMPYRMQLTTPCSLSFTMIVSSHGVRYTSTWTANWVVRLFHSYRYLINRVGNGSRRCPPPPPGILTYHGGFHQLLPGYLCPLLTSLWFGRSVTRLVIPVYENP